MGIRDVLSLNFGRKAEFALALSDPPKQLEFAGESTGDIDPVSVDQYIRMMNAQDGIAPRVGREAALSVPAVLAGRNKIVSISNLPLITYRGDNEVVENELLRQMNPFVSNQVTLALTIEDLLFEGISWWRVTSYSGTNGYPSYVEHLDVKRVRWVEPRDASPVHLPSGFHPDSEIYIDGKKVTDLTNIIRFDSPNPPLLKTVGRIIRRAIYTMDTSEMYARNPMPKLLFTPKSDVDPGEPEDVRAEVQKFADTASESPYNYVGAALDAKPLEFLSPADLQLVEIERAITVGVANIFGLDPEDFGVSTTSRTYQNGVDRRQDRINDVYATYLRAIEQRLTRGDVTPRGYFVRFDQDDYLKADPKTRMEVNTAYLAAGVITEDEVRQREGYAPFTPQQKAEIARKKAVTTIQPNDQQTASQGVPSNKMSLNFADEVTQTNFNFESESNFAVDSESRTISGLAVPFNETSSLKSGRRYQFMPGSLKYGDMRRVKLLRDHDWGQLAGYATDIEETDRGVQVTFTVAPGARGDEMLALAKHGSLDGMSIGLDPSTMDTYMDNSKPGIVFVRSAQLNEVSLLGNPAFPNSRVSAVYSTDGGQHMKCDRCGSTEHVTADCTAPDPATTFSINDFQKYQQIQALFGKTVEQAQQPLTVQNDPNVAPREVPVVEKTNGPVFVSQPGPYSFRSDSEFSLSEDLTHGFFMKGMAGVDSGSAQKRVQDWMDAEFAVTTTNVANLNPTINRQDMYVDQLDYEYPIWDTINKGAPPNGVTPFQFPKWAAAGTLVADHTEGVEPTLGSFGVTNQLVQPTALSGKIEINREAWDQGGQPNVDNLVRAEMRRQWYEGLETASAAFLDGLTLTGNEITIATATADTALQNAVIGALVDLLFTRGGYRLRDFMVQGNLYKMLALAKDGQGRLLFPPIGPQNAAGTLASFFSNLNINGLIGRPAWALGAMSSAADNSYLFNRNDVHGWSTAPQIMNFDIQVKSVYIGVWGYKAFALSRTAGIRRFIYDPVT